MGRATKTITHIIFVIAITLINNIQTAEEDLLNFSSKGFCCAPATIPMEYLYPQGQEIKFTTTFPDADRIKIILAAHVQTDPCEFTFEVPEGSTMSAKDLQEKFPPYLPQHLARPQEDTFICDSDIYYCPPGKNPLLTQEKRNNYDDIVAYRKKLKDTQQILSSQLQDMLDKMVKKATQCSIGEKGKTIGIQKNTVTAAKLGCYFLLAENNDYMNYHMDEEDIIHRLKTAARSIYPALEPNAITYQTFKESADTKIQFFYPWHDEIRKFRPMIPTLVHNFTHRVIQTT